jgi:hypothetical protein
VVGIGSVGREVQTPSIPPVLAEEHAVHLSVQALSQQTPSTQNPVAHSFAPAHAGPASFSKRQTPALHQCPDGQSESVAHGFLWHSPSTHNPLAQVMPVMHGSPIASRKTNS